jgi:hypothetical protein
MLLSRNILRRRNRRTFYYTIIMALQPSNAGGVVRRSSRNSPTLLVHRCPFERQQDHRERFTTGLLPFKSVPKAGVLVGLGLE